MNSSELQVVAEVMEESFVRNQKRIAKSQAERLTQTITLDRNGEPELMTWECRLPLGDGQEKDVEILRVPLASLIPPESVAVASVVIEVDDPFTKYKANQAEDLLDDKEGEKKACGAKTYDFLKIIAGNNLRGVCLTREGKSTLFHELKDLRMFMDSLEEIRSAGVSRSRSRGVGYILLLITVLFILFWVG